MSAAYHLQQDQSWSSAAVDSDSVIARQYRFISKFRQHPDQLWNKQSIYRVPALMRDSNSKAYEPRVVSIGPYHYGKEHLEAMEEHKHRALRHFLKRAYSMRLEDLVNHFREETLLKKVMSCYAGKLDAQWCDRYAFPHLLMLDGCFVLELLLTAAGDICGDTPTTVWCYAADDPIFGKNAEKHSVVPYVKMDMLLLENQIPLLVLQRLTAIAQLELDINTLIRTFYGCNHGSQPNESLGLHVLDVYRSSRLCVGDYTGWSVHTSADDLNHFGVRFKQSHGRSGNGGGGGDAPVGLSSFKDIAFVHRKERDVLGTVYDYFMEPVLRREPQADSSTPGFFRRTFPLRFIPSLSWRFPCAPRTTEWYVTSALLWFVHLLLSSFFRCALWWYLPLWVTRGDLLLPVLTVDETTEAIVLNLMAFERLHLGREGRDMAVTRYVFLMSSLLRSEKDVTRLRRGGIVSCLPERSDAAVVELFAAITRNVVVDDSRGMGVVNPELVEMCRRRPNKLHGAWFRNYGSDLKTWVTVLLTAYGVGFTMVNSVTAVLNYVLNANRPCSRP